MRRGREDNAQTRYSAIGRRNIDLSVSQSEISDSVMANNERSDRDEEMTWESAAREAVEHAIEGAHFNEERGVITLDIGTDHHGDPVLVDFSDFLTLQRKLEDLAETEWINYVPYDQGPVFEPHVDRYVENAMEKLDAEEFFARFPKPTEEGELFGSSELLIPKGKQKLIDDISEINEELIAYLAKNPAKMHDLHPRKFEELVAELFKDKGYDVELTRFSKDGGFDIRAVKKTEVGLGLTLIECKRFSASRPVGVTLIRGLYGVVEQQKATNGLCITTSYFTRGAKAFRDDLQFRLDLADFEKLKSMLNSYKTKNFNY
jgi:Restriction endonuclease